MLFCLCTDEKDVEKIVYEVDQELGGGELSLGWGIDLRERKNCKCLLGGGEWLQVKLNHALFVVPVVTRRHFL